MSNPIDHIALAWLAGPDALKYANSRRLYGASWNLGVETVLGYYGLKPKLDAARTIHDIVRLFRGRWFWKPDGLFQVEDTVLPPDYLLKQGGDDCDGWAMLHCQAINYALKKHGYQAWIITYYADPFTLSHHYCVVRDPQGHYWVVQPQPTEADWKQYGEACQTVWGPYRYLEETPHAVAVWYNTKALWWDKRDGYYNHIG